MKRARQKVKLQWNRWPQYRKTDTGRQRIWYSRDHRYKVVEIQPIGGLAKRYYALEEKPPESDHWVFVDPWHRWYRSKQGAMRACEKNLLK